MNDHASNQHYFAGSGWKRHKGVYSRGDVTIRYDEQARRWNAKTSTGDPVGKEKYKSIAAALIAGDRRLRVRPTATSESPVIIRYATAIARYIGAWENGDSDAAAKARRVAAEAFVAMTELEQRLASESYGTF